MEFKADLFMIIVKYHAYLRKMTRYNPTRGGRLSPYRDTVEVRIGV
jgi:hypothetical protein